MKSKLITAAACLGFVGYLAYLTLSPVAVRCEVCVEFKGQTVCRTASGATQEEAQKTATDTACAALASGRTESMRCSAQQPKSVRVL